MRFPQQHTSIAVLCNVAQSVPETRANRVADVALGGALGPMPERRADRGAVTLASERQQQYVGVYRDDKDQYQRIELKNGNLWLANYGIELIPLSSNKFGLKDTDGTISFSEGQMVLQLLETEKPDKYTIIQTRTPKDLRQFTGDFYSAELDATWQLRVNDGQLTAHVKHSDSPDIILRPINETTFTLEGGSLRFENNSGAPKRALLTVDRIRNIEFVKN